MSKKELRMIELWIEVECINFEIDMILSEYERLTVHSRED